MSTKPDDVCPKCGTKKNATLSNQWQDAYQCGTVYPFDGPHQRGEICIRLCKGQEAEKALDEWLEKTHWVQRNESGLFNDMLGWHRADCMTVAIDRLRAEVQRLKKPREFAHADFSKINERVLDLVTAQPHMANEVRIQAWIDGVNQWLRGGAA